MFGGFACGDLRQFAEEKIAQEHHAHIRLAKQFVGSIGDRDLSNERDLILRAGQTHQWIVRILLAQKQGLVMIS